MQDALALFGTDEPATARRRLSAGPLSADLIGGNLGAISFRGHEVLRAIAYIVRDRDWGTYDPVLEDLRVEEGPDGFCVRYRARCDAPDGATLHFDARIDGTPDGHVRFAVDATPRGDFETNRTGFCILHPIEGVAGQPLRVTHVDGSVEQSRFPDRIDPWQPFKDIRALTHAPAAGLEATCRMEGDAFEMEDQRAWTDASYKTYVRPLALPWPYRLPDGVTQRQSVTLALRETGPVAIRVEPARVTLRLDGPDGTVMPAIGLSLAPGMAQAAGAAGHLAALSPQSLLFHYEPGAGHGLDALRAYAALSRAVPDAEHVLEFVVPTAEAVADVFDAAASAVARSGLRIDAVAVLADVDRQSTPPGSEWPPCPALDTLYAQAHRVFAGKRIGGGMFSYFTELNRKRVPTGQLDFVTHATSAIVHAADDRSVMETLEAIPFITESTLGFIEGAAYRLGPTGIAMRQNPYGSRTMPNPAGGRVPMAEDDPRARGLFGAAFLTGYAARLAGTPLDCWVAAELAGPRGILRADGGVTPAYAVVRHLAAHAGQQRLRLASDARHRVDGYAARRGDGSVMLQIANLTDRPQAAALPSGVAWRDAAGAGVTTLELGPYADAIVYGRDDG